MTYNETNTHPRDGHVTFDPETHTYIAEGVPCDSVTTIVSGLFKEFDADFWARRKAAAEGVDPQEIKDMWERKAREARDMGTRLHDSIERYYLGHEPDDEALADGGFRHFLNFARHNTLRPYRSEWRIYSTRYRVAGTLDFLAREGDDLVIYDWKRSTKLVDRNGRLVTRNRYGATALHPLLRHIPDTSYYHYALQVSMYRYLLETEYGLRIADCRLGAFHPDNPCDYVLRMPYLRDEVIHILSERQ